MRFFFNKHKYIRVISFNKDKSSTITYHARVKFKPDFEINPDHIFMMSGYATVVTSELAPESINPLDFNSKYNVSHFKTAINNKIIADTFMNLKSSKFDLTQILLFGSLLINIIVLFILLKTTGII